MNSLITGAAGFIGSHLCQRLIAQGATVVGLDNFDPFYDRAIKRDNISRLVQSPLFKLIEGDIRKKALVKAIFQQGNFDTVVHLAAKAGVRPSIEDPVGYVDTNINGTAVLLEAAREAKIKKFIFASSSSVYGNNKKVPFSETDNVDNPISPYAATKKAGELICYTYSHLYQIDMTCLRFFTVYGPRQRPDLAIHKFAQLMEQNKPIPVYGDGSMERDFTYIDDILDGIVASMKRCKGYAIYNLGESRPVRLDVLIAELEKALGKKALINRLPEQPGDVNRTFADVQKAVRELNYQPKTHLADGLKRFVEWLRKK
ncbi:MAG: NAD-dependent epimerase/dehydratase family protein [Planctomycetes bacterium]|nr:NAD-dependent epimerase/dehydratase family protein [Planctomycetota bacterium]